MSDKMPAADDAPAHGDVEVLIVGAGIAGIDLAWRLQQRRPGTAYVILEARHAIGGTWDLFRYPGIRSDSDIATFAFPFRPWEGAEMVAEGPKIRRYVTETATEAGITDKIRFGTRVTSAEWSNRTQRWTVRAALDPDAGTGGGREAGGAGGVVTVTFTCRWLHLGTGYFDYQRPHDPEIPGTEDFGGPVVHPQHWPADFDYAGKRVLIIGSGATAVTLVPAMAPTAAHVTMLQRSPSYLAAIPRRDGVAAGLQRVLPARAAHAVNRVKNATLGQVMYQFARRRPETFKAVLRGRLAAQLPDDARLDEHFTPRYQPWDQRLCVMPDGDFVTAIAGGRASVVTGLIERIEPDGVRLADGRLLEADIIVPATGLRLLAMGGISLRIDGEVVDLGSRCTYRGLMIERVPNLSYTIGYINASWTLRADLTARYLCRLLALMERRGYGVAQPGPAPAGERRPLLDLSSGYVARSAHLFPRQGARRPWLAEQNYLVEQPRLSLADVTTSMEFTPAAAFRTRSSASSS